MCLLNIGGFVEVLGLPDFMLEVWLLMSLLFIVLDVGFIVLITSIGL